jgi:hypothetical protein
MTGLELILHELQRLLWPAKKKYSDDERHSNGGGDKVHVIRIESFVLILFQFDLFIRRQGSSSLRCKFQQNFGHRTDAEYHESNQPRTPPDF